MPPKPGPGKIRSCLFALSLLPVVASAIGLQEIEVQSSLNEPLVASIPLLSIDSGEVDRLRVSLASARAFEKAGLARPAILSRLQFRSMLDAQGKPVISVTSRGTIREPFLDFLLQVEGNQGRILKAFTILLDPPSYPTVTSVAATATTPQRSGRAEPPAGQISAGVPASNYGPVRPGETLWTIAKQTRPSETVSLYQMMIALQRQNPTAFINNNINKLRQGANLEIPQLALIDAYSKSAAKAEFFRQANQPASTAAPVEPLPASEPDAPEQIQSQPDAGVEQPGPEMALLQPAISQTEQARLQVIETNSRVQASLGDTSSQVYPTSNVEVLKEAIADSEHELVAVNEMQKSLDALQASLELKIQTLQQAVNERDEVISDLKEQIKTIQQGSEPAAEPGSPITGATAAMPEPVAASPAIAPTATTIEAAPPVPTATWNENLWLAFASASVLMIVLAILFSRRTSRTPPAATATENPGGLEYERYIDANPAQAPQPLTSPAEVALALEVKRHPDDMSRKVMLFEIYAFMKNRDKFSSFLEEVHPQMSQKAPELWKKVVVMGHDLIPNHPLIAGAASSLQRPSSADSEIPDTLAPEDLVQEAPAAPEAGPVDRDEILPDQPEERMASQDETLELSDEELDISVDELIASMADTPFEHKLAHSEDADDVEHGFTTFIEPEEKKP